MNTQEDFLKRSIERHNNKYDYSESVYTKGHSKVKIKCKTHNKYFHQSAKAHMEGQGCPYCSNNKKYDNEIFLEKARESHGDKYEYLNLNVKNTKTKVQIYCKIHQEIFIQSVYFHAHRKHGCPKCGEEKCKIAQTYTTNEFIDLAKKKHGDKYDYSQVNYKNYHKHVKIVCKKHGDFLASPASHLNGTNCPGCAVIDIKQEIFLKDFLSKYDIKFIHRDRQVIKPFEIDLFIPSKNLGIEINGIHWHSELAGKDEKYHLNKLKLARNNKIRLFQILESELALKPKIILSRLKFALNLLKYKIDAKKCDIRILENDIKNKFLNKYHIDGQDDSSIGLGLFYKNRLVYAMTFSKIKGRSYKLSRFCALFNFNVIDAATKLLLFFEENYSPTKLISFADLRWSNGGLYESLNFKSKEETRPNYWYFNKKDYVLHPRSEFTKNLLAKKLPNFNPNLSEWENMKQNKWNRIWDCGNMIFEKTYVS